MRIELTAKCEDIEKLKKLENGTMSLYWLDNNTPEIFIFGFKGIKVNPVAEFPLWDLNTYKICFHDVYMVRDRNMYVDRDDNYLINNFEKISQTLNGIKSIAYSFEDQEGNSSDVILAVSAPELIAAKDEKSSISAEVFSENHPKIKIRARLTKEVGISQEEADRLVNYLCDCSENKDISELTSRILKETGCEKGCFPIEWIIDDLTSESVNEETVLYLMNNQSKESDIKF